MGDYIMNFKKIKAVSHLIYPQFALVSVLLYFIGGFMAGGENIFSVPFFAGFFAVIVLHALVGYFYSRISDRTILGPLILMALLLSIPFILGVYINDNIRLEYIILALYLLFASFFLELIKDFSLKKSDTKRRTLLHIASPQKASYWLAFGLGIPTIVVPFIYVIFNLSVLFLILSTIAVFLGAAVGLLIILYPHPHQYANQFYSFSWIIRIILAIGIGVAHI